MRNLCGRGKELMEAVNGELVRLTRSSRSLNTRPLRAFIITSICSFIACIFATTGGGVISVKDGRLTFCRSGLLGALLPSGPSRSHRSALVPYRSSSEILCPAFQCSCSSKTWFCWVRHSTAAVRVCTYLSRAVSRGSSSWTLLVVSIDRVSTMQLFVREAFAMTYKAVPTDGANWWCRKSHQWVTQFSYSRNSICTIKKERPNREHRCGADQIPSESQVRTSHNSRVLEKGKLCVPWFVRVLGLL